MGINALWEGKVSKLLKDGILKRADGVIEKTVQLFSFGKQAPHGLQSGYIKTLRNGNEKIRSVAYLGGGDVATETIIKNPQGEIVHKFMGIRKPNKTTMAYSDSTSRGIASYSESKWQPASVKSESLQSVDYQKMARNTFNNIGIMPL